MIRFVSGHRVGLWFAGGVAITVAAISGALWVRGIASPANPDDHAQVSLGRSVYVAQCARCHGDRLEGEPNWLEHKLDGHHPAPPHDESGHTWFHPDKDLFTMTKSGMGAVIPNAGDNDMPSYAGALSDAEIWAVIAYIKASWSAQLLEEHERLSRQATR